MLHKALTYISLFVLLGFIVAPVAAQPLPSPAPEPPSPTTATPSPAPTEPDDPYPFTGCGGTGQKCCEKKVFGNTVYKCLFAKWHGLSGDEIIKYDANGIPTDGSVESPPIASCRCEGRGPKVTYPTDVCKRYFLPSNHVKTQKHFGGSITRPTLPPDKTAAYNKELSACVSCVNALGMYTSLGCIPTNFEAIIQLILTLGVMIGGAYALLCITFAAIKIQTSKGDTALIKAARENVTSCLIGLVLIIFSVFILNIMGSGFLGFTILSPLKPVVTKSTSPETTEGLMCSRPCIYSEKIGMDVKCFRGACPPSSPECGKPMADGVVPINNGCTFAPACNSYSEVKCP